MSNPRVIAATASAALIAGVGAGAAVYAVDIVTTNDLSQASGTEADQAATLSTPQDDKTTVYRSQGSDDSADSGLKFQPAPPSTSWNNNGGAKTKSNTSKSS